MAALRTTRPFKQYVNSRLAVLITSPLLALSLGFNFYLFKIDKFNLFSPERFQIVINAPGSNVPISRNGTQSVFQKSLTDVCGSGGCNFQIKDSGGTILADGLALDEPQWLESQTDGQPDLLIMNRTYPTLETPVVRVNIECFNAQKYTYDSQNCEFQSFDSLFSAIDELPALAKKLVPDDELL
ncbi:hypothetical protein EMOOHJMP_00195 [Microcystis phage MaAM05]|nr:hypothetical protein EMOOHJMP_00195 [Microcystis phage MaAM05]